MRSPGAACRIEFFDAASFFFREPRHDLLSEQSDRLQAASANTQRDQPDPKPFNLLLAVSATQK